MHVRDTRSFSAISRVVLWRIRDPNRLLLRLGRHQLQLDDQSVFRLWVKNHQNEICQTNFDTAVLLRLRRLKTARNFLWACDAFFLCENKKAKYDDNVPFDFPFFNERQTKTTQPIKKLFLPIDSRIANYQITKCVLHLDYASKPKNSTESIYKWSPQLLSCQPDILERYL